MISFPIAALLLQSIAQILLGFEAALKFPEGQIAFDTMGLPFSNVIMWLLGFTSIAYIHYPFVSKEIPTYPPKTNVKYWYVVTYD